MIDAMERRTIEPDEMDGRLGDARMLVRHWVTGDGPVWDPESNATDLCFDIVTILARCLAGVGTRIAYIHTVGDGPHASVVVGQAIDLAKGNAPREDFVSLLLPHGPDFWVQVRDAMVEMVRNAANHGAGVPMLVAPGDLIVHPGCPSETPDGWLLVVNAVEYGSERTVIWYREECGAGPFGLDLGAYDSVAIDSWVGAWSE